MIVEDTTAEVIDQVIATGKETVQMTIEGLQRIKTDLDRDADAYEGCVVNEMYDDLLTQINLLTALRNNIKQRCGLVN